jgi:hypothetical protein
LGGQLRESQIAGYMKILTASDVRWTGWLLVGGAVAFIVGAILWRIVYQEPAAQSLPAIAGDHTRWMWIHAWMVLGVVVTTVAFAGLRELLCDSGERMFATFAFALYFFGAVLGVAWLAFRLTAHDWAAAEMARTGTVPAWFPALLLWSGSLYAIHLALAYLSWIPLGASLLATGLVPSWLGWGAIGMGGVWTVGFVALQGGPFAPPFWAHVVTFAIGVALLRR